jgi:hypothetical protein
MISVGTSLIIIKCNTLFRNTAKLGGVASLSSRLDAKCNTYKITWQTGRTFLLCTSFIVAECNTFDDSEALLGGDIYASAGTKQESFMNTFKPIQQVTPEVLFIPLILASDEKRIFF